MAVLFRDVVCPPLRAFTASAPSGVLIGIIGTDGAGKGTLLRLASGELGPQSGRIDAPQPARLIGPSADLDLSPVPALLLHHALAFRDAFERGRAYSRFELLKRAGTTILMVSHELDLLNALADEIWWLEDGALHQKGDPREVLDSYRRDVARRLCVSAAGSPAIAPALRRGDGRAELTAIELLGERGRSSTFQCGEPVQICVTVLFHAPVADPVIGIMLRTRIGFEVYGTNTELERVPIGPCAAGDSVRVTFSFGCDLCPQEYTLTAASHDPEGVWHDWLEDALAFTVVDSRYTAGVANLRAHAAAIRVQLTDPA
jgi:lipopolysaccharide transport system ATP-binding protein